MIYGYARVSTKQQSIERQVQNITKKYSEAKIYSESFTGTTSERPEWKKLLCRVKAGDTIVFDSVSRMSRNAAEGVQQYQELYTKGIHLEFIKEPHINTEVYEQAKKTVVPMTGSAVDCILEGINKYLMLLAEKQIEIAFEQSEKEVLDLRQRTAEGMAASGAGKKIAEKRIGNTYTTTKEIKAKKLIMELSKDFKGSLNDFEVIESIGISRNTYYKYKREMK